MKMRAMVMFPITSTCLEQKGVISIPYKLNDYALKIAKFINQKSQNLNFTSKSNVIHDITNAGCSYVQDKYLSRRNNIF